MATTRRTDIHEHGQEDGHMEYTKLGTTGLDVSRICLGCMGFGDPERWIHKWVLDEERSRPVIRHALELGVTFFDTANVYSLGRSEEIVGRALRDYARRDEVVIATKVHGTMRDGPNGGGLSRKAILSEIDHSLARLGTEYVDLYQIHRWDPLTPIEETMEALHDVVRAGKARYIGASAMWAWQFQRALHVAERRGWTRFVSMQDHLNLLYREEEREMLPLCRAEGIGVIPYSPLASGRLTREWSADRTLRSETDQIARSKYDATADTDQQVVERVADLARRRDVPRVHIALAWLLQKSPVTAPIIGATKISHLDDAVGALSVTLTADEVAYLEEPYVPHPVVGHQ
ncbi:aryl-alcohol dehydrogenase-like predicted oxidoreductase [Deinococcus metalli]|uniref:Aryl-alcohol dehydrogenase-like predicted oxidoreductase n=1 Tax=Deinococcus metalli TaxID=1141878 RepID=A0A7W8KER8_9DEIO|nr:aldo/keto reductase [Deinococcus metalli]MBB5376423.1 aryl-alcohol dehydrogenase-like predicted oxidoreductase [Deinococcus metalli]GHF44161.1 NADP-dependent aryl-alcohol dehydrogenase [Deinococcus metalli]